MGELDRQRGLAHAAHAGGHDHTLARLRAGQGAQLGIAPGELLVGQQLNAARHGGEGEACRGRDGGVVLDGHGREQGQRVEGRRGRQKELERADADDIAPGDRADRDIARLGVVEGEQRRGELAVQGLAGQHAAQHLS